MAKAGYRGTILLLIVSALTVLAVVFFLITMNDINQVLRGVGQTPPEDLLKQRKESPDVERAKSDQSRR